jgi:hypothetical protein
MKSNTKEHDGAMTEERDTTIKPMSEESKWKAGWAWFSGAITLLICMGGVIWKTSAQSARLDDVVADVVALKAVGSDPIRLHIVEDNQIKLEHKERLTRLEQAVLQNGLDHTAIREILTSNRAEFVQRLATIEALIRSKP